MILTTAIIAKLIKKLNEESQEHRDRDGTVTYTDTIRYDGYTTALIDMGSEIEEYIRVGADDDEAARFRGACGFAVVKEERDAEEEEEG